MKNLILKSLLLVLTLGLIAQPAKATKTESNNLVACGIGLAIATAGALWYTYPKSQEEIAREKNKKELEEALEALDKEMGPKLKEIFEKHGMSKPTKNTNNTPNNTPSNRGHVNIKLFGYTIFQFSR